MSENDFIIDIHCHPNLKPFNSGHPKPTKNIWEKIIHNTQQNGFAKQIDKQSKHILKESQSHFYALAEGDVRVINISLYPIEKKFIHIRNIPKLLMGGGRVNIIHEVITGYSSKKIEYLEKSYNYYKDLEEEYEFIASAEGKSPDGKYEFIIATNYKELSAALQKKNTIVALISIEGAHVFSTGNPHFESLNEADHQLLLSKHIKEVKAWKHPPFTINIAHHFWNQLCGHSTSFKPPVNSFLNQNQGKDKGITSLGWHVIRELLTKTNGKRIIIDTKHMSVESRKEYYSFIKNYNLINPKDKIPIVCSHTAVNGFQTLDSSIKQSDTLAKAKNHRFYKWSINLSNDEIQYIHESEGLLGLMLDKGNLGGTETVKKITLLASEEEKRIEFCKLFWDNAFHIVEVVKEKSAWNMISLGTDFDGSITHLDPYESASKMTLFKNDLTSFLKKTEYKKELWYKYSPEKLVSKIMQENALQFYKKFFV